MIFIRRIRTLQSIEAEEVNALVITVMLLQKAMGCDWNDLMGK